MANDDIAREILQTNSYVVLSTAGADGRPWASPVWFASEDHRHIYWVSYPGARHSQNIADRQQIGMVVFDSTVAPGDGQAVYMAATAAEVTDRDEVEVGVGVFSRESARKGAWDFTIDEVTGDARLRLYRASVHEHSILDPDSPYDVRVEVRL